MTKDNQTNDDKIQKKYSDIDTEINAVIRLNLKKQLKLFFEAINTLELFKNIPLDDVKEMKEYIKSISNGSEIVFAHKKVDAKNKPNIKNINYFVEKKLKNLSHTWHIFQNKYRDFVVKDLRIKYKNEPKINRKTGEPILDEKGNKIYPYITGKIPAPMITKAFSEIYNSANFAAEKEQIKVISAANKIKYKKALDAIKDNINVKILENPQLYNLDAKLVMEIGNSYLNAGKKIKTNEELIEDYLSS